ncbi:hypothetical protein BofuT4_uP142780.1 [Botrytis cinerea T4]|uniref:Uncharacterized protein n=1 Tax=Botryotinia fuckeliana (strain T4) TaxID=999810 RepID=G2YZG8_BOTF4|nr:hypothetical protein BofuT4_uP142780.1 [Botrytis cinerea T4]
MLVSIAVTICFTIRFHHFVTLEAYRKIRLWWWLHPQLEDFSG